MMRDKVTKLKDMYTHAGVFHADDLFSTALLRLAGCNAELHRVTSLPDELDETAIVYDIGMGEFDHHQSDKVIRKNGIPYAAFGLLFRELWPLLMTQTQYEQLDTFFIQEIDAADNGTYSSALSRMVSAFNRNWNEDNSPESVQKAFDEAIPICSSILRRIILTTQNGNKNVDVFDLDEVCTRSFLQIINSEVTYEFIKKNPFKGLRSNGIPFCSFGFAAKRNWNKIFNRKEEYNEFDKVFVQDIDATNAGTAKSILSYITHVFNPIPGVDFEGESCPAHVRMALLEDAICVFSACMSHVILRINASEPAEALSFAAAKSAHHGIAFMDCYVPVRRYLADDSRVNWIGYPSMRGGYSIATFRDGRGRDKALHPTQFRGLPAEQLPHGMLFCHPEGFIAEFADQDHAKAYAEQYLYT